MHKENGAYIHNGIFLALNKKEILSFTIAWMNMGDIITSKIRKAQKDKNCMISLTCGN